MKWALSSAGTRAASISRYEGEPDGNLEVFVHGAADSVMELEFCGTQCTCLGVLWVDDDRLIFIREDEYMPMGAEVPERCTRLAILKFYDFAIDSVYTYQTVPAKVKGCE